MIKTINKMGRERKYLEIVRTIYDNQYHTQWWKTESFSSKITTRIPTLNTPIQQSPSQSHQARISNKRLSHREERSKSVTFCR